MARVPGHALGNRRSLGPQFKPAPARWRTLVAGPLAEWLAIVTAGSLWSSDWRVWISLGLTNALLNVVPWGIVPNDGTQLLRYWAEARKSPRYRLLHRS